MDSAIRLLQRAAADDPWAASRFRREMARAGRGGELALERGDVVVVREVESPWIRGRWLGWVVKVLAAGDKYVMPFDGRVRFRVVPTREYLRKGLYLTREDVVDVVDVLEPGSRLPEPPSVRHGRQTRPNTRPKTRPKSRPRPRRRPRAA